MFDKTRILTATSGLVGFRADDNAMYSGLSATLKSSSSGLYVNDLPGVSYEVISANLSNDAASANTYLTNLYEAEVLALIHKFSNTQKNKYNSRDLLSNHSIVSGVANFSNRVTQNARFVGYWIRPHKSNNLKIQIKELGFQATETQGTPLKIYLYETSQLEPVATFDYTIGNKLSLVWRAVTDFILYHQSQSLGTGQNYLLGYYETDPNNPQDYQLQSQALYMDFDCGCSNSPGLIHGKYMGVHPIEIQNANLNWDSDNSEYNIPLVDDLTSCVSSQTYGLTAKVNVTCDITDVLVNNISMFAEPLQHALAARLLYDAYASNRINSISDSKRADCKAFAIKYDGILNGYADANGNRVKGRLETLSVDFSGLDKYCLQCKPGIEYGNLVR